jgi:hypothetical protein
MFCLSVVIQTGYEWDYGMVGLCSVGRSPSSRVQRRPFEHSVSDTVTLVNPEVAVRSFLLRAKYGHRSNGESGAEVRL